VFGRPPPPPPPAEPCRRCSRSAPYIGPLDEFGTCPACAEAIKWQLEVSWPRIEKDCDQLGAFHAWCREFDDTLTSDDPALD
jgi:hypothetical protein